MLNESFEYKKEFDALAAQGLARSLPSVGQDIINLSSNDYLGLSRHPDVIEAAISSTRKFGTGGTSSRLLAGTGSLHRELEKKLAHFLGKDKALVFSSGYHANTGILPALTGPEDLILFDRLCHASLIDGIRLSRASFAAFDHNDSSDLEAILKKKRNGRRRIWIVTEGFFSMDGDTPPLKKIIELARQHNALVYLDEAHSLGVAGRDGRGFAEREGLLDQIDLFIGTLSKSFGSQGGFAAGSEILIDLLISKCRSFIYTTALAPSCVAAALESLRLFPLVQDRRNAILGLSEELRTELKKLGFNCLLSVSPIVPVWTGSVEDTKKLSEHLFTHGFFVPSIRPPTVPAGEGRVRLSVTYECAAKGMRPLIEAFEKMAEQPKVSGETIVQKN